MTWMIVRKEILENLLSLRFAITCVICLMVIPSSIFVLAREYGQDLADYHNNLVIHRKEADSYTDPYPLTYTGIQVDRPPNVMRIFSTGSERRNTVSVRIRGNTEPQFEGTYGMSNPMVSLFPTMDFVFFVSIVMSLLAIVFSYDAICGEKESGTLRLMLSFSIPRDAVLLGKWIGGYITLAAPFVLAAALGLLVLRLYPNAHLTDENGVQLLFLLAISLMYVSAWYSLGLFVSARTAGPSLSITILLLAWVIIVLGIPNTSPYVAGMIHRLPSIQGVEKEKAEVEREEARERRRRIDEYDRTTLASDEERSIAITEIFRESFLKISRQQEKLHDNYNRLLEIQLTLAQRISRSSMLSSLIYSIGDVTDTGLKERQRFRKALAQFRRTFANYAEDKWIERAKQGDIETSDHPRFIYERPSLSDRSKEVFLDVFLLLGWNILFFAGAYVSFLGYDVR